MGIMDDVTFDDVSLVLEQKGINTEGFDTEELMVAAFLAGAASTLEALIGTSKDINEALRQRYNGDR
jgi:hypothetical protein